MCVNEMRDDDCYIRQIEGRGCDIKYRDDGLCGADADEVEADTKKDDEPDGGDGGRGVGVDGAPEAGVANILHQN